MNVEGLFTAVVGGLFTIAILTVILSPGSGAVGVINASGTSFATLLNSAKARP